MASKTTQPKSQKVPKLRFASFKDGWRSETFQDIFTFHKTNSFSRAELSPSGEVMNVHYGDIHKNHKSHFDFNNEKFSYIDNSQIISDLIQNGDLIIADASEDRFDIGKSVEVVNINKKKSVAGLHTFLARPKGLALGFPGFLMRTENVKRQLWRIATGASVLGISKTEAGKIKLSIPSLPEQQKIAEFLGGVDEWIENLREQKENLESYKKGMMQKIFSQGIRFKDDEGKTFPKWEEESLGSRSKFFSGGTPSTASKEYYSGLIPFIKSGEISCNYTEQYISEEALENSSAKMVNKGDLLYALYGATSGMVAISKIDGAINQAVLCIRTEENKKWLLSYLDHNKERILAKYLQGGQGNLSADIVKKLKIYFPSLPEQQKIAEFLGSIDKVLESKQQQISQAEQWKKGLMQGLFV